MTTFAPSGGELIVECRVKVTGSRISIVGDPFKVVAIYVLHGDQAAVKIFVGRVAIAILESHASGIPDMTSVRGRT